VNNLALTCPSVSVDSTYPNPEYCKERMYDGITEEIWWNKWSSYYSAEPHWAIFDFQETKNISGFRVYHVSEYATRDYKIQSWNGQTYVDQVSVDDNTEAAEPV